MDLLAVAVSPLEAPVPMPIMRISVARALASTADVACRNIEDLDGGHAVEVLAMSPILPMQRIEADEADKVWREANLHSEHTGSWCLLPGLFGHGDRHCRNNCACRQHRHIFRLSLRPGVVYLTWTWESTGHQLRTSCGSSHAVQHL